MTPYPLGRYLSTFDYRDYPLRLYIERMIFTVQESFWDYQGIPLDQMEDPFCGGFSIAVFGICLPLFAPYTNESGKQFYMQCKIVDGEPGARNGTCIRSMGTVMVKTGMVEAYAFATDILTLDWWLLHKGPVIVGTVWTNDMFFPDENNVIHCTGAEAGGHAYVLNGKKPGFKHIQNTWDGWGVNGGAWISDADFEKIFAHGGEAITAVEAKVVDPALPVASKGCLPESVRKVLRGLLQ